ncbi:hypothetical protein [Maridesulfovibrio frigidus]|uniref:hypothetical protein n=1 Tax=Maridesulfovibrio frigidus TaxID=340956 RepID=UPI000B0406CA|nr:hypothetical protein [Maridesulfovibrio frigidus]
MNKNISQTMTLTKERFELIEVLESKLVPCIEESVGVTLSAYELDREINQLMPGYIVGCYLYANLLSRLQGEEWIQTPQNSNEACKITLRVKGRLISINISKVDPDTRIPTGAKSLKKKLGHKMHLPGMVEYYENQTFPSELNIGYDVSIASGLGKVTLDRICGTEKKQIALTEAVLFDSQLEVIATTATPVPEQIITTEYAPKRDNKENEGKD